MTKTEEQKPTCHELAAQLAADHASEERCQRKREALKEAASRLSAKKEAAPTRPKVPIQVIAHEDYIRPQNRSDEFFSSVEQWSSWREYEQDLSRRLAAWPHLPRKGDVIADEADSVIVISVLHDVTPDGEHITVFVGESEEPHDTRPAAPKQPPTAKPLNVNVVLDEEHTNPDALQAEHYQPDYKDVDDYLDTLGTLLSQRTHPPQVGERISTWGRPHGPAWYVLRVDVELDPGEPENTMYGVYLGTHPEPIEKTPATAAGSTERKLPEEIPGGYGRVMKTGSVIEDMDCEARLMHSQVRAMRLLLERDMEEKNFGHYHYQFASMLDHIEAELEVFRDRFGSMLKGYFGESYEQY